MSPEERSVRVAYCEDLVRLELENLELAQRIRDVEDERDFYRALAQTSLSRSQRLTALVRVQRRTLHRYTREYEVPYAEELRSIDAWLESQLSRPDAQEQDHA